MVKHKRRSHLSSILSDHHPAIDREACGSVSRLSGQFGAQGDLFFSSPALSQAPVESSDSRNVIICGETNVHGHDSSAGFQLCVRKEQPRGARGATAISQLVQYLFTFYSPWRPALPVVVTVVHVIVNRSI